MSTMEINVNGKKLILIYKRLDPFDVQLDASNHRIGFLLNQLPLSERTQDAIELLLQTQEEVIRIKKSIQITKGVQEAIFVRWNNVVAEGNRRLTAYRELLRETPGQPDFVTIPAWIFPEDTPEEIIQQVIHSQHLNHKRQWPPLERAQVFKHLHAEGDTIEALAAQFEMKEDEVRQFIEAVNLIQAEYIPLLDDPSDPDTRDKFSYFLEYIRGPRIHKQTYPDLDQRFATWVKDKTIPKAERVRKLGKILENPHAMMALEDEGFDAALEVLIDQNPNENPHYRAFDRASRYLQVLNPSDIRDLRSSPEKQQIIMDLARSVTLVAEVAALNCNYGER